VTRLGCAGPTESRVATRLEFEAAPLGTTLNADDKSPTVNEADGALAVDEADEMPTVDEGTERLDWHKEMALESMELNARTRAEALTSCG
jgi:hypothetical protein